jgi:iron complex outermembrane recepter protein
VSFLLALLLALFTVRGEVRDALTGEPVSGVVVASAAARGGTVTDDAGRFALALSRPARVRFARVGYQTVEHVIASDTTLIVRLEPAAPSLERVTVTALRGDAAAPIPQRTMDRQEVERRYVGQDVPLLLTGQPSVTSYAEAGGFSNYTYLRLRGIDHTRVNITLDGVPLNDPEDQFVYFSNFPDFGNSLESVQIQRGVGTSSYGTAAYAGAINFQSMALASAERSGEVQLGRGSFGTTRGSGEWVSGRVSDRFAMYARLSAHRTEGYRHHSGNTGQSYFANGGYFGARDIVKITAFGGRSRNELAYLAVPLPDLERDPRTNPLAEDERDDFQQHFASASWTRALGPQAAMQATAYTIWASGDYDVRIAPDLYNFQLASRVTGALATWSARTGRFDLDIGAHASSYHRDHSLAIRPELGSLIHHNTGRKREQSAFAKAVLSLGEAMLYGDLQLRHPEFEYVPSAGSGVAARRIAWTFVNPKVGITWELSRLATLYASYGSNGREPTRNDMFAGFDDVDTTNIDFVGPLSRVRPERVYDTEAGVRWRTPSLSANLNVFDMRFRNEITPVGELSYIGLPLRKNVRSSYRRGLEADITWRLLPTIIASANATMSRNRIAEYTDDATGATHQDVEPLLTPTLLLNNMLDWQMTPGFSFSVGGRYVGRSFLANTGDRALMTPSAYLADAGLAWRSGRHEIALHVMNAGSARFYAAGYTDGTTPYYFVTAPRAVFLTATLGF